MVIKAMSQMRYGKMRMSIQRTMKQKVKDNKVVGSCECCGNYVYDEENEYYVCEVDLDEDDMVRFLKGDVRACPYYQSDDEYKIVRKQIQW